MTGDDAARAAYLRREAERLRLLREIGATDQNGMHQPAAEMPDLDQPSAPRNDDIRRLERRRILRRR
jgi:hypothetical protein